ncbi:hypothetical protein [Riemerella columbipharyngis]|uniref:Uncharacterized protein n=1 Tax=Riemerella columbipharyngis TaxID=1071918 RepID=A0A1G7A103_9FLAO|nr:hypothetical protein [Riemerella columbipharyngis]SDE08502.1 hypothetical protein SAMN05421544_1036 [Riemerella columbipharyngis]
MNNHIEELKNNFDTLFLEQAKNTVHLLTLTKAFWEVSSVVLNKAELANLKSKYYHSLYEKTHETLTQNESVFYQPSKIHFALLEMKSVIDELLRDAEDD